MSLSSRAAIFVDYQNLFEHLNGRLPTGEEPDEHILSLIDGVRHYIDRHLEAVCVQAVAYADFNGLSENAYYIQRDLSIHGVECRFVPIGLHETVIDMRLCVDVLDTMFRRSDITTFVILTADREMVPLLLSLQSNGRRPVLVSFGSPASVELLDHSGPGRHVDAREILERDHGDASLSPPSERTASEFKPVAELPYGIDRDALEIIDRHFGQYEEIYLTPLLRKLSEELGEIEGHEPKTLIGDLEMAGAVRLEKRRGVRYDYTVLILNPEHPEIRVFRHELQDAAGDNDGLTDFPDRPDETGYDQDGDDRDWRPNDFRS